MARGAGWVCLHMVSSLGPFLEWLDLRKMKVGIAWPHRDQAQKSHIVTSSAFYWSHHPAHIQGAGKETPALDGKPDMHIQSREPSLGAAYHVS